MSIDNDIQVWGQKILKRFNDIDLSPVVNDIKRVIATSIDRNFSEGGRYGNDNEFGGGSLKWKQSARAEKKGGQTLVDKAGLVSSIQVTVSLVGNSIAVHVGSNKDYAAIHQFGGKIKRNASSKTYVQNRSKNGKYTKGTKNGQGSTSGSYTIDIPARPYLVLQNEDIEEIIHIVQKHIFKVLMN